MTPIELEGILTDVENDSELDILFPYDPGQLATLLYLDLSENWDAIPGKTRSVIACVGAALKRQHYRELQAYIDAAVAVGRSKGGLG